MNSSLTASAEVLDYMYYCARGMAATNHDYLRKKRLIFNALVPYHNVYIKDMGKLNEKKSELITALAKAQNNHNAGLDTKIQALRKIEMKKGEDPEEYKANIEKNIAIVEKLKVGSVDEIKEKTKANKEATEELKNKKVTIEIDGDALAFFKINMESLLEIKGEKGLAGIGDEENTEIHCKVLDVLGL